MEIIVIMIAIILSVCLGAFIVYQTIRLTKSLMVEIINETTIDDDIKEIIKEEE